MLGVPGSSVGILRGYKELTCYAHTWKSQESLSDVPQAPPFQSLCIQLPEWKELVLTLRAGHRSGDSLASGRMESPLAAAGGVGTPGMPGNK